MDKGVEPTSKLIWFDPVLTSGQVRRYGVISQGQGLACLFRLAEQQGKAIRAATDLRLANFEG